MNDKSKYSNNSDRMEFFEQFPPGEREEVKKMWEASGQIPPRFPDLQKHEIENALSKVNSRIDSEATLSADNQSNIHYVRNNWRWIAAAAVILLIAGASFLIIPKTVSAPNGKITSATLPDGTTVELNSGSELRFNRLFSFTNRNVELNGEAFFSVKESDHPFIVQANHSTIKVTGTEFNVRSWSGDPDSITEVTVSEGRVQFYRNDSQNKFVTITPGQLSRLTNKMKKPTAPENTSVDRIIGWREHKLMFNNQSLTVIFNELERRFDVRIQIENPGIGKQNLSTYYANPRNVELVLKDICRVKGLKYAETANGYRIYE